MNNFDNKDDQHDYNVRIWNANTSEPSTVFISGNFNNNDEEPYNGIFFTQAPDYLSVEAGTHDEHLISEITHLCKTITENFTMLDYLLRSLQRKDS